MHDFLIEKLNKYYDVDEVNNIIEGLLKNRFTTIRLNYCKNDVKVVVEKVLESFEYEKIIGYDDAYVIKNATEKDLWDLDIYKNGYIYIQSLSSMKPVYVLEPQVNENILDMCAAPGSKTTMIQSITKNKTNLTAVELHKERFLKLKYNVELQGANVYLININALQLDNMFKFDKILLDAPCSGSGILDLSNENYLKYFTDTLISKCVNAQKKLVDKAYKLLKKDGILVYSTCSLLNVENEDIVEYAKKIGFKVEKVDDEKNSDYIKILPDEYFEGFFIIKMRK